MNSAQGPPPPSHGVLRPQEGHSPSAARCRAKWPLNAPPFAFAPPRLHCSRMTQAPAAITPPLAPSAEIPESFFRSLEDGAAAVRHKLASPPPEKAWQPQKAMYWYDSIIDWMFAHPGGAIKECAADLGRSPVTIGLIVRSDLFKARYAARRARFNEELDSRLVGKLAKVAEVGLDLTLEVMAKKRDSIPLPLLTQLTNSAMDRLGYGPAQAAPSAAVVIHNNNGNAQTVLPETVTPAALARARESLRQLQAMDDPKVIEHRSHEVGLGDSAPQAQPGASEARLEVSVPSVEGEG